MTSSEATQNEITLRISKLWASVISTVLGGILIAVLSGAAGVWQRVIVVEGRVGVLEEVSRTGATLRDLEASAALGEQQYQEILRRFDSLERRLERMERAR